MTNNNSLGPDPLTTSNNPQPIANNPQPLSDIPQVPVQSPGEGVGGYIQANPGPVVMEQTIPIQVAPVQTAPIQAPASLDVMQNPFTQPIQSLPEIQSIVAEPVVAQSYMQTSTFMPPTQDIGPIEVNEIKPNIVEPIKTSGGKINIVLGIFIFLGIILLIILAVWIITNNANKQNTINDVNITPTITQTQSGNSINPTTPLLEEDASDALVTIDETRIVVNSPLPNQFIPKEGATMALEGQMKGFFEGTMNYRILDDSNTIIATGIINAEGDNYDAFANFNEQITIAPFTESSAINGKIEFFEESMKDGSTKVVASIPLKFQ
jgi:hypothetical protein